MFAIERGAGIGGDIKRAFHLAAVRIHCVEPVSGAEPDVLAVVGDAMHTFHTLERAVFPDDVRF
jgi:hypothetical protein